LIPGTKIRFHFNTEWHTGEFVWLSKKDEVMRIPGHRPLKCKQGMLLFDYQDPLFPLWGHWFEDLASQNGSTKKAGWQFV